jgi:hypothetical protein
MRTTEFQAVFLNETLILSAISIMINVVHIFIQVQVTTTSSGVVFITVIQHITGGIFGIVVICFINRYLKTHDKLPLYLNLTLFITFGGIFSFFVSLVPGDIGNYGFLAFFFVTVILAPSVIMMDGLLIRDLIM